MSIIKPGNGENPKKKPSILGKISKRLIKAISPINNEEAWNNFSPETQKEMLESLDQKDRIDLYSIDLTDFCDIDFNMSRGEIPTFREGIVQIDEIGKYIMINGMKCRERRPGITGFAYNDINTRYDAFSRLRIGFCNKGVFKEYVTISNEGNIPRFKFPDGLDDELGGTFYEVDNDISEGPLANIQWLDIYELDIGKYYTNTNLHSKNWKESDNGEILEINGTEFKPFKENASGFVYKEFVDNNNPFNYPEKKIMLAEYKDGKMVGKGLVLCKDKPACIICR